MILKRLAQACVLIVGIAVFLPWQAGTIVDAAESVRGLQTDEGPMVVVVCLITIALIQVGWRTAWIGAGFVAAISGRTLINLIGAETGDAAVGLWIATLASVTGAALLIVDMFAGVSRRDADSASSRSGSRGLSGPLGRRRQ